MAINRNKIIENLSQVRLLPNEKGLIEGFNVLLNQLPAKFWNGFAARLIGKTDPDLIESVEFLLINAAHECGYHTGHGIITSPEWETVVAPMIENGAEDVLHGAYAVLAAFGWANAEIIELIPNEKMVVRAYDYYEADIVSYGKRNRGCAYMLRGISAAFMDLAYGGEYDKTGKTGMRTFTAVQTKGIECGDLYGEFIVTRA